VRPFGPGAVRGDALSVKVSIGSAESSRQENSVMKLCNAVAGFMLFCAIGIAQGQEPAAKSTSSGVFSNEQAKRGEAAYNANCVTCHGAELRSTDREVPHLSDKSFKFSWIGKTIAEKYESVRDTMPPKEEHSLSDQVYLDIVTYVLKFNKVPVGDRELKPNLEILKQITIAAPPD
jgi:quinoprotein glucose dehydrogenase